MNYTKKTTLLKYKSLLGLKIGSSQSPSETFEDYLSGSTKTRIETSTEILEDEETPKEQEKEEIEMAIENIEVGEIETTKISKETTINGDLISGGHIEIYGTVKGNVAAKNNVKIYGSVQGDIVGEEVELHFARVCGNIDAKSTLTIVDESILTGNIKAKNLVFNARQKGNIFVENLSTFMSKSRLLGNVATKSVSIIEGTKISGDMKISEHEIDDAEFSDLSIA